MISLAASLKYEEAQRVKEKIDILENYQAKSTVVNPKINNVDVFSIISDESYGYVNYLQISLWCDYSVTYHGNKEKTG